MKRVNLSWRFIVEHYLEKIVKESPLIRLVNIRVRTGVKGGEDVETLKLINPVMSLEESKKAKESKVRLVQTAQHPDTMEETEESKRLGLKLSRKIRKEQKEMAKKHKKVQQADQVGGQKVEKPKVEKKSKAKFTNKSSPPSVEVGKRAIWHDTYSYKNTSGTTITVVGHWEVIKKPEKQEKPKTSK